MSNLFNLRISIFKLIPFGTIQFDVLIINEINISHIHFFPESKASEFTSLLFQIHNREK